MKHDAPPWIDLDLDQNNKLCDGLSSPHPGEWRKHLDNVDRSIDSTGLGEFLQRGIAVRWVEELVEWSMVLALHDWKLYQAAKENDSVRQSAAILRLFRNQNSIEVRAELHCAEL